MSATVFSKEAVRSLHAWAHESLNVLFAHAATLPYDDLVRPLDGFGYSSVRDQLVHICFVEELWVRQLQGIAVREWTGQFDSVAAITQEKERVVRETANYLERLSENGLNTPVRPAAGWSGPARSPAFIIQHIVTHAFHHKGQVVAMCRILGFPATDTDLQRE